MMGYRRECVCRLTQWFSTPTMSSAAQDVPGAVPQASACGQQLHLWCSLRSGYPVFQLLACSPSCCWTCLLALPAMLLSLNFVVRWSYGKNKEKEKLRRQKDLSLHQLRKRRHIGSEEPWVPSTTKL
eukprot:1154532-Pelagomonas_calceolata.AAC.2